MSRFTADAVLAEIANLVRQVVASSLTPQATARSRLRAGARQLRLTIGRTADFVYGEVRRVEAHEADQIRFYAAEQRKKLRAAERDYERARKRLLASGSRLALVAPPKIPDPADCPRPRAARKPTRLARV